MPKFLLKDLLWREGWGGVVKAEFTAGDYLWTFLACDDGTYCAYKMGERGQKGGVMDDLTEEQANTLLEKIHKETSLGSPAK